VLLHSHDEPSILPMLPTRNRLHPDCPGATTVAPTPIPSANCTFAEVALLGFLLLSIRLRDARAQAGGWR